MTKVKAAFFFHDPETDVSYRGPMSASMALYRGETGYAEFAGKILQVASATIFDDDEIYWANGRNWRFDEMGLADQAYMRATSDIMVEMIFEADPYGPTKDADWKMKMRRLDAARDMVSWNTNPALRKRLDDYLLNGVAHPKILTTRGLTKVYSTRPPAPQEQPEASFVVRSTTAQSLHYVRGQPSDDGRSLTYKHAEAALFTIDEGIKMARRWNEYSASKGYFVGYRIEPAQSGIKRGLDDPATSPSP
jgi:hypothetical protein